MDPNNKKSSQGFSLIETLVGVVVMTVTMFAAGIFVMNTLSYRSAQSNILNMNVVRKQLASAIQNPLAWSKTIEANASLSCFKNILVSGSNDCSAYKLASPTSFPFPAANNLKLYDSNDVLIYDSTLVGGNGLTLKGVICSTFSAVTPDPICPLQPTISFRAVCPSIGVCVNPPVVVRVDFLISDGQQLPSWLNKDRFSIEVLKPSDYCPAQFDLKNPAPSIGTNTTFTTDLTYPSPYIGGLIKPTTAATGNISLTAQPVYFCAQTEVAFTPSTGVFDNTNPNRVCLEYSAGSCDFEWLETSNSDWVLKYQGAIVYSLQTPTSYPPSQNLKFLVQNGMVSFYSDDYIQYYFQLHMTQTFIARFLPAPQAGDPVGMIFDINSY